MAGLAVHDLTRVAAAGRALHHPAGGDGARTWGVAAKDHGRVARLHGVAGRGDACGHGGASGA